jgi:hypothetical protein
MERVNVRAAEKVVAADLDEDQRAGFVDPRRLFELGIHSRASLREIRHLEMRALAENFRPRAFL